MTSPYPTNPDYPQDTGSCTFVGKYIGLDGAPLVGKTLTVHCDAPAGLLDPANNTVITPVDLTITLDGHGAFSKVLTPTDSANLTPQNWTYTITENWPGGRQFSLQAPSGTTVNVTTQRPVPTSSGTPIALAIGGGGGGAGTVKTVNSQDPDSQGNVSLTAAAVGAASTTDLAGEASTRANADAAEASARTAADNAETTARQAADTNLQNQINSITASGGGSVTAEAQARANADAAEAAARQAADQTLQNNIDAETSRAEGAETTLQTNIGNEATRATGAEASLQNQINNLGAGTGGGGSLPSGWVPLSGLKVGTANAAANVTYLNSVLNNAANVGNVLIVPPAGPGNAYFINSMVTITQGDIHLLGFTDQYDVSASTTGGATFRDVSGFTGAALFQVGDATHSADHCSFQGIRFSASYAANAVIDCGASVQWRNCGFYAQGGVSAAPGYAYNGADGPGGGQARCQLIDCQATGGGDAANGSIKVGGTDFILSGGRYTGGTKLFTGSGFVVTGAHFTGDSTNSANLHNTGAHNTFTGIQIDTGTSYASLYNSAVSCAFTSINFYSLTQNAGQASLPMIIADGTSGPKLANVTIMLGGSYPAFTYMIQFVGSNASKVASSTVLDDISGCNFVTSGGGGNIQKLWNITPGAYSNIVGSDALGNRYTVTGNGPEAVAAVNGVKAVSFDPATRSATAAAVGVTAGTNIIDGTLYLTKVVHPDTAITGIGKDFSAIFTSATLLAMPVYVSDGTTLALVGTIDLLSAGYNTGVSSLMTKSNSTTTINWTIPRPEMTVYVGFVQSGATAGGIRCPSGQQGVGVNDWLGTGVEPRFASGGVGITTLAGIPASIAVSALSQSSLPLGPFLVATD